VGTKVFSDGQVGGFGAAGMSYPDFIFFMLSEEDKSSESALKYWYDFCDWFLCVFYSRILFPLPGSRAVIWMVTRF
jgi:hypothetical protein